jgi:hypothetical protein
MFANNTPTLVQALAYVLAYNAGIARHYCMDYISDFCSRHSGYRDEDDHFGAWKEIDDNILKYMLAVCVAILDEVRVEDAALSFDPRFCIDEVSKAVAKHSHFFKDDVDAIAHDRAIAGIVGN